MNWWGQPCPLGVWNFQPELFCDSFYDFSITELSHHLGWKEPLRSPNQNTTAPVCNCYQLDFHTTKFHTQVLQTGAQNPAQTPGQAGGAPPRGWLLQATRGKRGLSTKPSWPGQGNPRPTRKLTGPVASDQNNTALLS